MSELSSRRVNKGNDPQLKQRPPSNLNLRNNDNAFHVLASLLVEFFQARLIVDCINGSQKHIINISSDDKTALQRLLPKTAMWDFIDAVSYRLEMTPVVPTTPIHFLTLQCQELCLDKDETMENPILAAYEITMADSVTVNVLSVELHKNACPVSEDESGSDGAVDYRGSLRASSENSDDSDGFVHTNVDTASSGASSSDKSGIKVASSKDIADEMMQQEEQGLATNTGNRNGNATAILSDNDSMPTEYDDDDDDFEEFLTNDRVDPVDVHQLGQTDGDQCDDNETGNDVCNENTNSNKLIDETDAPNEPNNTSEIVVCEKHENDYDTRDTVDLDAVGCDEDEGEEIEILPTLTGTFDDETIHTAQGTQETFHIEDCGTKLSGLYDVNRNTAPTDNEFNETEIGEEIDLLPTETVEDATTFVTAVPGVDKTKGLELDNDVASMAIENQEMKDIAAIIQDSIQAQTEEILSAKTTPYNTINEYNATNIEEEAAGDGKENFISTTEGQVEKIRSIDSGSQTTNDATAMDENPADHIHDVAGTFFSELRHLIDEKIEAFEYAVVNAIVAKPFPRPKNDLYSEPPFHRNTEPIHKVVEQSTQIKCEELVRETITKKDQSLLDSIQHSTVAPPPPPEYMNEIVKHIPNKGDEQSLLTAEPIEGSVIVLSKANETDEKAKARRVDDRRVEKQASPTSFSVHSGFTSLFAGLAASFAPTEKGGDSRSVQEKSIISTFPSDESNTKTTDASVVDFAAYDAMQVTNTAAKQQLLIELREACTLMKQSITPETTRFWSDHIHCLKERLDALEEQHNDRETYCPNQATIPLVTSDIQSTGMMSEIRSTKGIPVVPALTQVSNDMNDHYNNDYQPESILNTPDPNNGEHICVGFEGFDNKPQQYTNHEIELSESRGRFGPTPSDELYSQPNDSNAQQTIDDGEDGYYEYPLVDVVAPADLPGGYHFEAEIEGQRFLATVPAGGVQQGETFTCFMKELDSVAIDIPVGAWKDGLWSMCELGWCHPVLWNAIFCPLIALGQIQTRVDLDFLGRPKFGELPYTNRFMVLMVIASWVGMNTALFGACNLKWSRGLELSVADGCAFALVNVAMFGFIVFVTQSTRSSVREKFMIRERCCYDLEDVCCAALCLPCTVGQMQRHTANYDDYEAVCCSKTGLPNGVRVNQETAKVKETTLENEDGFMV